METVTQYGCARCGEKLINAALIPLEPLKPSRPSATKCKECGSESYASDLRGFQCSPQIHSLLQRLCTLDEFKQLRLDPTGFVAKFNSKPIAGAKQHLEVDVTTKPPTIRNKS